MRMLRIAQLMALAAALACVAVPAYAQRDRGELQIEVHDPQGASLDASGELVSEANQFHLNFQIGSDGRYTAKDLAFGVYRVSLSRGGFVPSRQVVDIRSTVPRRLLITLGLKPVETQMEVSDSATLVDPQATTATATIGTQTLQEHTAATPGRGVMDAVDTQPGWLQEANGVLHPRGSEYDVQFVVDGIPITENRSPAFGAPMESSDVESMRVMTAGIPAEYGRKLGGIVEVSPPKNYPDGWHGEFSAGGGSFDTGSGHAALFYSRGENRFTVSGDGSHTARYLDPPVLSNYSNVGNADGLSASYERDLPNGDRVYVTFERHAVRYLVPNELVQQLARQRQDVRSMETGSQINYTHAFSTDVLFTVAGQARDSSFQLASNESATPVIVSQQRGYREGYVRADLAGHRGRQEWKIGADAIFSPVREQLQYRITDASQFDSGTAQQFQFSERRWDVEPSAYIQDQIRLGKWNVSAGLRFDHYGFVVHQSGWSPRLSVSRYVAKLDLLLHASYDRVFQTPAMENLLLASSAQLDSASDLVLRLPVQPARANYYEVGFTKSFAGALRIDGNVFRRSFHNYSDDDVLLDTGISFPIAFASAEIHGEEIALAVPHWGRYSGFVSYSNQTGVGQGPITGGLFLGSDAAQLPDTNKFSVSQDQRNSVRAHLRYQAAARLWLAGGAEYGSGLPADLGGPASASDISFFLAQYGPAIVNRVNFALQRVRPNFSLNAAAGATLYHKEARDVSIQVEGHNITNRVNVINFASLFSGTAVGPPANVSARLRLAF
jgi:hypothetical protein